MHDRFARVAVALLCVLGGAASVSAQITTATVTGAVKDEQGAVIPGAAVALVSDTRGTHVADAVSNANGDFVFPNIPGDTYTVEVTLEGFKKVRRAGLTVSPGDRIDIPNMCTMIVAVLTRKPTPMPNFAPARICNRLTGKPNSGRMAISKKTRAPLQPSSQS